MAGKGRFAALLALASSVIAAGALEIGPDSIFGTYDQERGPEVRFCWAQHLPGRRMKVLPVPSSDEALNTTAVALRHMLQLDMDDLQSCKLQKVFPGRNAAKGDSLTVRSLRPASCRRNPCCQVCPGSARC